MYTYTFTFIIWSLATDECTYAHIQKNLWATFATTGSYRCKHMFTFKYIYIKTHIYTIKHTPKHIGYITSDSISLCAWISPCQ